MERAIRDKKIGGFVVNPIGIGTWKMGGHMLPSLSKKQSNREVKAIKYSVELGQNHIDTAELYGSGQAERLVAQAIKGLKRKDLYIASKVWSHHKKRKAAISAVESTLERLKIDYLDLIYIHFAWSGWEETLEGLNDVVDAGLAKGLAVSNFDFDELQKAVSMSKHPVIANQVLYSVYRRSVVTEEMLKYCKEKDIMIVAYTPVEDLFSFGKNNSVLEEIARKYERSMVQVALNWLIVQDNVITIPKAVSKVHIDENIGALDFKLSEEDFEKIKNLA